MSDPQTMRKGKQLWMDGTLVAECASEAIAELIRLALVRGSMSRAEAAHFERAFK